MAEESGFWRWAGRVATHAPWIAKAWPYAVLFLTGPMTAYFAALKHLDLWQVWLLGWTGLGVGAWCVAGVRLAYVKWSPWGKMARGELSLHRRQLIAQWRAMVTEVNREYQSRKPMKGEGVRLLLEGHPGFPSLRPHLSQMAIGAIGGWALANNQSSLPNELDAALTEVDRLETEWRLKP